MFDFLIPYIEIIPPMSVIIAVMLILVPFMNKKYVARARYYVWLVIAIRLLLPFDISLGSEPVHFMQAEIPNYAIRRNDVIEYGHQQSQQQEANTENINTNENITADVIDETGTVENNNNQNIKKPLFYHFPIIRLHTVIEYVWVIGTVSILLFNCLQYILAKRELKKNSVYDEKSQLILNRLCAEKKVKKPLPVYRCCGITSAMIVGIITPAIYMPDTDIDHHVLEMMLRHELTHYKRKDIVYKFVLMLACCVHWFNPLVWLMDRQAQKDIEISCDEDVIKGKSKEFRHLYSDSIMKMVRISATKRLAFSTGFSNDKQTLISRFKNIYDNTVKGSGKTVIAGILALSVLSTTLISCSPQEKEDFEIPRQAMELMEFMLLTFYDSIEDDFLTNNTRFNSMQGFNYLKHIGAPIDKYIETYENNAGTEHYEFPFEKAKEIYQFLLAKELGEDWNEPPYQFPSSYTPNYDYNRFSFNNIELEYAVIEKIKIDENTFTTVFSRTVEGVPYNNVFFTMEKQIIDYVPEDLADYYAVGEEIWRINDMGILTAVLNPVPQTIEINTADEFIAFVEDINCNGLLRQGNTYLLNADIDLSDIVITPIGRNDKPYYTYILTASFEEGFNCIFDGQGYTISNLSIRYSENDIEYNGLFSVIGKNGVVKNLNIENAVVAPTDGNTSNVMHGTGILAGKTLGAIENCHVSGSVSGIHMTGGLCGDIAGIVSDCTVNADVYGANNTGGLSGAIEYSSVVKNCSVSGTVNGIRNTKHHFDTPWLTGGFAGSVNYCTIENCHTSSQLVLDKGGNRNGIFCGDYTEADIINCTYDKNIANINRIIGYRWSSDNADEKTVEINPI